MMPSVRTIEMHISKELVKQFIEEKIDQFGFKEDDAIIRIDLADVPDVITMKVRFKKEQEVEVNEYKTS